MNIAIVTNMLAPYRIPLFRALAARPEVSRLTVLVCVDKERDRDWTVTSEPGFEVVRCWGLSLQRTIGGDRLRVVHLRFGVMQWLATQRPDHVLIGDASWTSYLATLACRVLGIPYSVWSEITPVSRVSDGLAGRLRRWMYGGAHRCVAASGEAARFLAGQGVPELRIRRAINAVDVTQLQTAAARWWPERHAVRSSLGIPPDAFVFLYVGQFIARKRVKETVALLEQAAAKHPVHLILAGSGPLEHALREQTVACQHLTTSFVGFVEGDALWRLYAAAHALILLSDDEPWGMVISEALACGLPFFSVATVAAAVEFHTFGMVCNGLADAASALEAFLESNPLAQSMDMRPSCAVSATPDSWAREVLEALA
jgi:glycosyltransferase involved in cell wall biosynthesis